MESIADWLETEGGAADWVDATKKLLPAGECAPHVEPAVSGACLSAPTVRTIADALGTGEDVEELKRATSCASQHCVLDRAVEALETEKIETERQRLKPQGPASTNKWLSNPNIDESLAQWAKLFDFTPIKFAMMNFASYDNELRNFHPLRSRSTFACVLNTDHHPGRGKHWVCVFGDRRTTPQTVEYFNSSGRPPPKEMTAWMVFARNELRRAGPCDDVVVAQRAHQKGDSECGVYCLFYIWSRLNGVLWNRFRETLVSDDEVSDFRQRLFVEP